MHNSRKSISFKHAPRGHKIRSCSLFLQLFTCQEGCILSRTNSHPSFRNYLLKTDFVPGIVLGNGYTMMSQISYIVQFFLFNPEVPSLVQALTIFLSGILSSVIISLQALRLSLPVPPSQFSPSSILRPMSILLP